MISKTTYAGNDTSPRTVLPLPDGKEAGRIGRFVVIGCTSVAIDLLVYSLLTGNLGTDTAKGLSYLTGMVFGFFGNKWWTFGSRRSGVGEPLGYLTLYMFTLVVNVMINAGVLTMFGPLAKYPAFLVATGTSTVLNYLGLRLVTFRLGIAERESAEPHVERRRAA